MLFRLNVTKINARCQHVFCGTCLTRAWSMSYKKSIDETDEHVMRKVFRCPECRTETVWLMPRSDRQVENAPFRVDQAMNCMEDWIVDTVKGSVKKLGERVDLRPCKVDENLESLHEVWCEGGDVECRWERGKRCVLSVECVCLRDAK
jgi:hypothetical protein